MFAQLGTWLHSFLSGYVVRIVSSLETDLAALAAVVMTVIIALYGLAIARGETNASMGVFSWSMVKRSAVIAIAGTSSLYMTNVVDNVNALQVSLSTAF